MHAIEELVEVLKVENEPEKIQNAIFNTAKKHGMKPANFFKTPYKILIGIPRGPRMDSYILAMGKQNVIDALQNTLNNQ